METAGRLTEEYIAGSLLIDGDAVAQRIRCLVNRDDFKVQACGAVFGAAMALYDDHTPIDPASISNRLRRSGEELPVDYLAQLMEITPTAANCVDYAHRGAEAARVRRVKALAAEIQEDESATADELVATIQREAAVISGTGYRRGLLAPAETLRRFTDHVVNASDSADNVIPSGFPRLDEILGGGFLRGGLYIIGARPAMGKTAFSLNLADSIRGNVLLVSLEMSPEQLTARRVSTLTGIPATSLLAGSVSDEQWERIVLALSELSQHGVYTNTRYDLTVTQIQIMAQAVENLTAVIIDYLGLIQPAPRGGSLYETVTQTSRELKRMAVNLGVPVICLAQLSRSVEGRDDKRPRLSDLRDSGAIEQDADAVMFLYRDDYYHPREDAAPGFPSLVELDVAKNRHARTGRDEFSFWPGTGRFMEVH